MKHGGICKEVFRVTALQKSSITRLDYKLKVTGTVVDTPRKACSMTALRKNVIYIQVGTVLSPKKSIRIIA